MGLFDDLKDMAQEFASKTGIDIPGTQQPAASTNQPHNNVSNPSRPPQAPVQPARPVAGPPPMPGQVSYSNAGKENLFDPRMEKLIDAALADGVLTEKEKQVLFKRAEAMGYDLDEFEMVLDAKLYDRTHSQQQATQQAAAPKSDKYGDVRKCPSCGAIVETYTAICPSCGYAFHNVGNVSSFEVLSKKLETLESQRGVLEVYKSMFGGGIENKQANLIKNFPVPTAKDDILEFLTMASPLAQKPSLFGGLSMKSSSGTSVIPNAWYFKCKQVIMKARIALKNDKDAIAQIEEIAKQLKIK